MIYNIIRTKFNNYTINNIEISSIYLPDLAWTQRAPEVPGIGVGRVLRPPVEILHDPVQPAAEVVLGPTLDVVMVQLLGSLLKMVNVHQVSLKMRQFLLKKEE